MTSKTISKFTTSGIYGIFVGNICMYVGQSQCILKRICDHNKEFQRGNKDQKYSYLHDYLNLLEFKVLENTTKEDLLQKELEYIRKYNPIFNIKISDMEYHYFDCTKEEFDLFMIGLYTEREIKNMISVEPMSRYYREV